MADIAQLGIVVDTSQAKTATGDLKQLTTATDKAADSTDELGQSSKDLVRSLQEQISRLQAAGATTSAATEYLEKLLTVQNDLGSSIQKQASSWKAANDNVNSFTSTVANLPEHIESTGKSFLHTTAELIKFAGYMQLAGKVIYNANPALQQFAATIGEKTVNAVNAVQPGLTKLGDTVGKLHPAFGAVGGQITQFGMTVKNATSTVAPFYKILDTVDLARTASDFTLLTGSALALSPALRTVATNQAWDSLKAVPAVVGTATSALGMFSGALGSIARIAFPILTLIGLFKLFTAAIEAGNKQLDDYVKKLEVIEGIEMPAEFFLKLEKSATEADVSAKSLLETVQNFEKITEPRLGGSDLAKMIEQLERVGNFKDLGALEEFKNAVGVKEQMIAIGKLLDEATDKHERLAALEIARMFMSKEMLQLQKANGDAFSKIVSNAQKMSDTKIMDPNVAIAADDLNTRLEAAYGKLNALLEPMEGLDKLALAFKNTWVSIVEILAEGATRSFSILVNMSKMKPATAVPVQGVEAPGVGFVPTIFPSEMSTAILSERAEGLLNIDEAQRQVIASSKKFSDILSEQEKAARKAADAERDLSKALNSVQWQKAVDQISRHTALLQAEANATDRTVNQQEQLRTEVTLLSAASASNIKITSDKIDQYIQLRSEMSAAAALGRIEVGLGEEQIRVLLAWAKAAGEAREAAEKKNNALQSANQIAQDAIAVRALTAFSPTARAQIAEDQIREKYRKALKDQTIELKQVEEEVASARNRIFQTEIHQLTETQRMRELGVKQAVDSARVELSLIGRSVGEQYRLQQIEQARQQLEQDAASRRATFDEAEFQRTVAKINQAAQIKQTGAELAAQDRANFEMQTVFLSDMDKQIASIQFQLHGTDWHRFMNDGLAATMRLSASLRDVADTFKGAFSGMLMDFNHNLQQGQKAWEAFGNAAQNTLNRLTDKLLQMATDNLWRAAFPGGGGGSFLQSILGTSTGGFDASHGVGGPGWFAPMTPGATSAGATFARGGILSGPGISTYSGSVVDRPTIFPFARGMGLMGEGGPEAVMPLKRGPGGKLGIEGGGANLNVQINNTTSDNTEIKTRKQEGPDGPTLILDVVKKAHSSGEFDSGNSALYGIRRRKVR
jgi:phage-related minor tail protein